MAFIEEMKAEARTGKFHPSEQERKKNP